MTTSSADAAVARRAETPAEAAAAMMHALQYLEREARQAGFDDLASTIAAAAEAAAAKVGGLNRQ